MKGFGIEIKNDLLDPKHIDSMGAAVWLYMWLLDKMTSISEEGIGLIWGGKPIKYQDVAKELGGNVMSERTYSRWVTTLKKFGYINTKRTAYGLIFSVYKAYKRFGRSSSATNGVSPQAESPKVAYLPATNGRSNTPQMADVNKTITLDNNTRQYIGNSKLNLEDLVKPFSEKYDKDLIDRFLLHWTQVNAGQTKQLWQMQKVFDVGKRLATWNLNAEKFNTGKSSGGVVTLKDGSRAIMRGGKWVDADNPYVTMDLNYYPELANR